jgi:hypothetical protein
VPQMIKTDCMVEILGGGTDFVPAGGSCVAAA